MSKDRRGRVQAPVVMLVLFAIAAGTWIIAQRSEQPTAEEQLKAQKHLNPELYLVKEDDISKVVVERGDQKIVLERRGPHWQMTEPIDVRADTSRVNDVIRAVRSLERLPKTDPIMGTKQEPLNLAEYQLDKPDVVATLFKGSESFGLQVGEETSLGGEKASANKGTYVKLPNENVISLVRPTDLEALKKEPKDLRQRQLVTSSRFNADFAQLEWPDRKLVVSKSKDKWRVVEPINDRADQTKVGELIGKVADLRIEKDEDFIDDKLTDPAKYGLDKPRLVAEFRRDSVKDETDDAKKSSDGKSDKTKKTEPVVEKLLIGSPIAGRDGMVYAQIADQKYVVAIPATVLDDLAKQPNDLRSRDLVELSTFDVDYVRVEREAGAVAIGKKDSDWEIYQPKQIGAESTAVNDLVKKIDEVEIAEFIDGASAADYELDKPALSVLVYEKGLKKDDSAAPESKDNKSDSDKTDKANETPEPQGTPTRILFGKRDDEKKVVYVKRGDESGIFAVNDSGLVDLVDRGYLAYRRKQVISFLEGDVAKLAVQREGKTFSAERKKEKETDTKETWRLIEPVEAPADSSSISDILFSVTRLNAKKFYAEGPVDLAQYGLAEPMIRATITLKKVGDKDPEQHVLLVGGEEESGAHYAKLAKDDLVFAIEPTLVNYLKSELHDHSVLSVDSAKVEGLTLTWPDATLELVNKKPEGKPTKEWAVVGNDAFKLDTAKPRELVNYLAFLHTEAFDQYQGSFTDAHGFGKPALIVTVTVEGQETPKTLRIGAVASEGKRFVATGESSGPVAIMPETQLKGFLSGPGYFAMPEESKPEPEKNDEAKKNDDKSGATEKKPDTADSKSAESKPNESTEATKPDKQN